VEQRHQRFSPTVATVLTEQIRDGLRASPCNRELGIEQQLMPALDKPVI
jgi:hypothetical protein